MKTYLAINKNKDIVQKSSSGGVFYSLAKYILDKNGIVFGAAWNTDWLVDMKYVDNLEDLPQLMKSKYVKADVKKTFQECKEFLDQGKLVLYSGVGCQLFALKAFLKKEYNNLILCEICCHGIMPLNIWKDYLKSIQRNFPIINIDMRDKSESWENWKLTITYEDGYKDSKVLTNNPYIKAFLSDKYLSKGCYSCTCKNTNSVADIIIGDLWSLKAPDSKYKKYNDHKGCSFIHIVSPKIETTLTKLNLTLVEIDYNESLRYNSGTKNIIDESKISQYDKNLFKKKVAIISLPLHTNIGGYMQSYALKTIVEQLDYVVDVINYTPQWFKQNHLDFIKYINPYDIGSAFNYKTILDKGYSSIIVGSDQIWRPKYCSNRDISNSFLKFALNSNINKIAYGPSFGADIWEYTSSEQATASTLIKQFSAVSVREFEGVDFCSTYLNTKAEQVLDPTMLLDKEHYINLCKGIEKRSGVFTYFLDNDSTYQMQLNKWGFNTFKSKQGDVLDWLAGFRDCDYVITDSFHGCVFSIIFNKPFICIENKSRGLSRFNTLKKLFNIEKQFVDSISKVTTKLIANFKGYSNLSIYKDKSLKWLESNLKNDNFGNKNLVDTVINKDKKICLVGIGKIENNYIREWVEHHKALGFNKIFLFDNNDIDGEHFEDVIGDYVKSGYVEIINVRGKVNQQIECYNKIYNDREKMKDFDWIAFFDIDELLSIDNGLSVQEFVSQPKFNKFNCIAINWKYYDDNGLVKTNGDYRMKDRFTHEYVQNTSNYPEVSFTKRIVKCNIPGVVINSSHGPLDRVQNNEAIYCTTLKNPNIVCCTVDGVPPYPMNGTSINNWSHNGAHLKHYRFKTIEEYITNKMKRGYPTLYKNMGKDLNLNDFFRLNELTDEKVALAAKLTNTPEDIIKASITKVNNQKISDNIPKQREVNKDLRFFYRSRWL